MKKESPLKQKIIQVAVPTTIENILATLVGFVDAWLIAKIGLVAVTGVGLANSIFNVYIAVFTALGVTVTALVAKHSVQDLNKTKAIVSEVITYTLIAGLIVGAVSVIFSRPLLAIMGADQSTIASTQIYFQLVGGFSFATALNTLFASIIRATGDAKTPLKINLLVNVINIIIDYLLIFGVGPLPALGVLGTALGTVIARIVGICILYAHLQKSSLALDRFFPRIFQHGVEIKRLVLPATAERLVMRLGQVLYFSLIMMIGAKTFSAHSIAGSIEAFTYMPAYGLAAAATILTGNALGQNDSQSVRKIARLCVWYGICVMSALGLILWIGAPMFARFFTEDAEAIRQIVTALRIDAFAQPVVATSMIMVGSFQGMGDTKTPLYSTLFGMWVIRVVGVVLLGLYCQLGIAGVWLSILIDLAIRSIFLVWRFRKKTIA